MFGLGTKTVTRVEQPERGFDSYDMRLGDEMRGERATLGKSLMDVQRELRIKASYIAAIENAEMEVFDSPSFVAGYVRSYARYLGMDAEIVFARFCEESGFAGIRDLKPLEPGAGKRPGEAAKASVLPMKARPAVDPLAGPANPFARRTTPAFAGFEPGALGSMAVLALLVGGIGYGGWTVLQEIQRVQVAPVEDAPRLVAELDPLTPSPVAEVAVEDGPLRPTEEALTQLYRPRALEAPVLVARDAPISTIEPGAIGALASAVPRPIPAVATAAPEAGRPSGLSMASAVDAAVLAALGGDDDAGPVETPRVLAAAPEAVVLLAVRESWVRVRSAEGDTLMERTLQPGETWEVPPGTAPATLRTGNSGAVYFSVAGQTYGPVAPGAQVVSNVALAADAVTASFETADLDGDRDLARVVAELASPEAMPPGL